MSWAVRASFAAYKLLGIWLLIMLWLVLLAPLRWGLNVPLRWLLWTPRACVWHLLNQVYAGDPLL
jgi:hypothetical protein